MDMEFVKKVVIVFIACGLFLFLYEFIGYLWNEWTRPNF